MNLGHLNSKTSGRRDLYFGKEVAGRKKVEQHNYLCRQRTQFSPVNAGTFKVQVGNSLPTSRSPKVQPLIEKIWSGSIFGVLFVWLFVCLYTFARDGHSSFALVMGYQSNDGCY